MFDVSTVLVVVVLLCCIINPTKQQQQQQQPLLDDLFPNFSLRHAYESYPIRSCANIDSCFTCVVGHVNKILTCSKVVNKGSCGASNNNKNNNTKLQNVYAALHSNNDYNNQHLISIYDLEEIFENHPDLVHGKDYRMMRKTIDNNNNEWFQSPNRPKLRMEEMQYLFNVKGFSLLINNIQTLWEPILVLARQLYKEFWSNTLSVNMYMTPSIIISSINDNNNNNNGSMQRKEVHSGFEAHFDWMDVLVVQVSGRKLWQVANYPLEYLTTPDLKRKPTGDEISYHMKASSFIILNPGDVLYIPRGHVHNASSVPIDLQEDLGLFDSEKPSIHLTFGLEHSCETTLEAMLHHAIHLYFMEKEAQEEEESLSDDDKLLVTFLHFALSEIARRDCSFDQRFDDLSKKFLNAPPPEEEIEEEITVVDTETARKWSRCHLRKSVKLHEAWSHKDPKIVLNSHHLNTIHRMKSQVMHQDYVIGLEAFSHSLHIERTISFIKDLKLNIHESSTDQSNTRLTHMYCFPMMRHEYFDLQFDRVALEPFLAERLLNLVAEFYDQASTVDFAARILNGFENLKKRSSEDRPSQ